MARGGEGGRGSGGGDRGGGAVARALRAALVALAPAAAALLPPLPRLQPLRPPPPRLPATLPLALLPRRLLPTATTSTSSSRSSSSTSPGGVPSAPPPPTTPHRCMGREVVRSMVAVRRAAARVPLLPAQRPPARPPHARAPPLPPRNALPPRLVYGRESPPRRLALCRPALASLSGRPARQGRGGGSGGGGGGAGATVGGAAGPCRPHNLRHLQGAAVCRCLMLPAICCLSSHALVPTDFFRPHSPVLLSCLSVHLHLPPSLAALPFSPSPPFPVRAGSPAHRAHTPHARRVGRRTPAPPPLHLACKHSPFHRLLSPSHASAPCVAAAPPGPREAAPSPRPLPAAAPPALLALPGTAVSSLQPRTPLLSAAAPPLGYHQVR
ncbi:unnamed protein product [Closterium sp. NIES-54]